MEQVYTFLKKSIKSFFLPAVNQLTLINFTVILLLTLICTHPASAQQNVLDKRITIKLNNVSLADALTALGDKASASISYSSTKLDVKKHVSINATNRSLKNVLYDLLGSSLKNLKAEGDVVTIQTNDPRPAEPMALNNSDLNEVVVVSSRSPQHISDIPGTVWVIDSTMLQSQIKAGVPLKEALGILIPGLDIGNQGRSNYAQNIRGRNILVMIDGVSINSTRNTSRQFDAIDPFNIEKIEVLSGASSVYGGDATGGIINIVTKKAKTEKLAFQTEIGGRSGLKNGDDHDLRIAQSVSGGNNFVKGRLGVAFQQNGAAYDGDNNQIIIDTKQGDLQYNRSIDLFGNVDFKLKGNQSVSVDAQYYNSAYNSDRGLFLGNNLAGGLPANANNNVAPDPSLLDIRKGFDADVVPRSKRIFINGQYRIADILGGQSFQLQAFTRSEKLDFSPSFPEGIVRSRELTVAPGDVKLLPLAASRQNTNVYGFKGVLSKQWDKFRITYGADLDHESFVGKQAFFDTNLSYSSGGLINKTASTLDRYPGNRILGLSGFAQAGWTIIDNLTLSAGIRQQHMQVSVDDFVRFQQAVSVNYGIGKTADKIPGGKNDYNVTLFNGNLIYKFSNNAQVWANYSQGFSVPDPTKYYGTGNYVRDGDNWKLINSINVAQTPLSGIKTEQYEIGGRLRTESGFKGQLAGYYSVSDKAMIINTSLFTISVTDQKVRNYGFEGEFSYSKNPEGFEIGTNGQFIVSEIKLQDIGYKRNSIISTNPSKFAAFTGWRTRAFSVRLQASHSLDLKDYQNLELDGFTTFDLLANVKLPLGNLSAGIQNLFDKQYLTFWGQRSVLFYGAPAKLYQYYGRGRTFSLTYTINY